MSTSIRHQDIRKASSSGIIGASETNTQISEDVGLNSHAVNYLRCYVEASAAAGTVTLKLQHRSAKGSFVDTGKSVLITGAGTFSINVNPVNDPTIIPLFKQIRLVVTTAAASSATITDVRLEQ